MAREIVIISGKGGTGKTSVIAAFASLIENAVFMDCDVDAADLHILMDPKIEKQEDFSGGHIASIRQDSCTGCNKCHELCRFDAVKKEGDGERIKYLIDEITCEGCGVCAWFCPEDAIDMVDAVNGEWYVSETRFGPLVHAKLGIAEENSGKLVSKIKGEARMIATERGFDTILIDGSPGTGCPVIASISGVDHVLAVTEPTLSAKHDLNRVVELAYHFKIPVSVCINKWDINPDISSDIEQEMRTFDVPVDGKLKYDDVITKAQIERKAVTEFTDGELSDQIKKLWKNLNIHFYNENKEIKE